jgi:hypothetical protein
MQCDELQGVRYFLLFTRKLKSAESKYKSKLSNASKLKESKVKTSKVKRG